MNWRLECNWSPKGGKRTRRPRNNRLYRRLKRLQQQGVQVDLETAYRDQERSDPHVGRAVLKLVSNEYLAR